MAKKKQPDARALLDIRHLWLKDVEEHDYDSALSFLRLKVGKKRAKALVEKLRGVEIVQMRANDILRACGLAALEISDPETHQNMVLTIQRKPISPVLVVSLADGTSTIADGYHRVSWANQISPLALVPGRLVAESGDLAGRPAQVHRKG
jgi:hypothetical protein